MTYNYEYLITGTAVGVKAKDGVVLAAEKRVSYGFYMVSKSGRKVFRVLDNVGVASAGVIADMQVLSKIASVNMSLYELETRRRPSVRAVAKVLSHVLFRSRLLPYIVELIVGGIDEEGPHIYVIDSLGSVIEDDYSALGSGAKLAIAIIEDAYRPDITVEQARELAIRAIRQSISRDPVSGDGIDLLTITASGCKEETIPLRA